jgi:hypothetical protein
MMPSYHGGQTRSGLADVSRSCSGRIVGSEVIAQVPVTADTGQLPTRPQFPISDSGVESLTFYPAHIQIRGFVTPTLRSNAFHDWS